MKAVVTNPPLHHPRTGQMLAKGAVIEGADVDLIESEPEGRHRISVIDRTPVDALAPSPARSFTASIPSSSVAAAKE
jgi:hypothetical protein